MKKIIRLTESDLMNLVKRVIKEQGQTFPMDGKPHSVGPGMPKNTSSTSKEEGRNNPNWIMLVNTLKNLSYPPKVLTFNSYDTPPIPSQSLNWGKAKSSNGKYGFGIESTDSKMPQEIMSLFNSDDRKNQMEMHKWWSQKGYKTNGNDITINFKDADKLKTDIESFFKVYRPE